MALLSEYKWMDYNRLQESDDTALASLDFVQNALSVPHDIIDNRLDLNLYVIFNYKGLSLSVSKRVTSCKESDTANGQSVKK